MNRSLSLVRVERRMFPCLCIVILLSRGLAMKTQNGIDDPTAPFECDSHASGTTQTRCTSGLGRLHWQHQYE